MIELHGNSVLCIGDAHITKTGPGSNLDRVSALGQAIYDARPKNIVNIGDWGDFPSLAAHLGSRAVGGSGSTRGHSGKTIDDDLLAFEEALWVLDNATRAANERHVRGRHKERIYTPRKIFCAGNHEARLDKVPQHIPELDRIIGTHLIRDIVEAAGWEYFPFLHPVAIGGVSFAHFFESGTMGKATPLSQALNRHSESHVWGHSHTFGYDSRTTISGRRLNAVCLPTFKAPRTLSRHEESGVVWLNNVRDGDFEIARTSTETLLKKYNNNRELLAA